MEHLSALLRKKLSHPRFKEALLFGTMKEVAEKFFLRKGMDIRVTAFDEKTKTMSIKTKHPAQSREALGFQLELNDTLRSYRLSLVKKIIFTPNQGSK